MFAGLPIRDVARGQGSAPVDTTALYRVALHGLQELDHIRRAISYSANAGLVSASPLPAA